MTKYQSQQHLMDTPNARIRHSSYAESLQTDHVVADSQADQMTSPKDCSAGDWNSGIQAHANVSQQSFARNPILQLQRRYGNRYVQRMLAVSRQGEGEAEVTPDVESSIERARSGGQGLDSRTRLQMESAFGVDFGGVRIHIGAEAHSLNRAVSAVAFTTGQDIFFRDGAYDPGNSSGRELLAHELTHVVQQGGATSVSKRSEGIQRSCPQCQEQAQEGEIQAKMTVSQPQDADEVEAEQMAKNVTNALESNQAIADVDSGNMPISPLTAALAQGLQLAHVERNEAGIDLLGRSLDLVTREPGHPVLAQIGATTGFTSGTSCSCGGRCLKCQGHRAKAGMTEAQVHRKPLVRDTLARANGSGQRTILQCINANLSNAGIPWAVIAIIAGVCTVIGALATSPTGPGAAAGGAGAAALCLTAVVPGLTFGMAIGIITRCIQDPSAEWIFAQADTQSDGTTDDQEAVA